LDSNELVEQLRRGDPVAQDRVYRQWYPALYRTCSHILGYRDPDIEDILQETFLSAFEKIEGFQSRGEGSLFAWVRKICVNRCYTRWRDKDRLLLAQEQEMDLWAEHPGPWREEGPGEPDEKVAKLRLLCALKAKLNDPCRRLVEMRDVDGESYVSISRRLKMPMGTVMSRLYRCREALKRMVSEMLRERP
jgi:RNA polymerase sigma factor (sigma-70 family)